MITQIRYRRHARHRGASFPLSGRKAASIRDEWPACRPPAILLLIAGAAFLALPACQQPDLRPSVELTAAGAQIPIELIESWLRDSPDQPFVLKKLWPMRYAGDGFGPLAEGKCDIACVDRPLNKREMQQFEGKEVAGRRVGFYGYALYVHPGNRLDAIFAKHLSMVMQGEIKDWHQLAGEEIADLSGPIRVYGLGKGTRAGMQLSLLARIWFADPSWTVCETDEEIINRVAEDPLALGFAGIGYDGEDVRYLGLRMQRYGRPAFPSLEEIESERYGLAKVIYIYYAEPASESVQAVLDYLYSDAGRAAMESTSVWPVPRARSRVWSVAQ
jgi:ABC-type phosphate transport system substrate-binding protein